MTVEGYVGANAEFIVSFTIRHEFGIEIDFNDQRAEDRTGLLRAICTRAIDELYPWVDGAIEASEKQLSVNIALSPAFEGGFTRDQMDYVEDNWDGEYDTVISIRFDGAVDDIATERTEVEDIDELEQWRTEWR